MVLFGSQVLSLPSRHWRDGVNKELQAISSSSCEAFNIIWDDLVRGQEMYFPLRRCLFRWNKHLAWLFRELMLKGNVLIRAFESFSLSQNRAFSLELSRFVSLLPLYCLEIRSFTLNWPRFGSLLWLRFLSQISLPSSHSGLGKGEAQAWKIVIYNVEIEHNMRLSRSSRGGQWNIASFRTVISDFFRCLKEFSIFLLSTEF